MGASANNWDSNFASAFRLQFEPESTVSDRLGKWLTSNLLDSSSVVVFVLGFSRRLSSTIGFVVNLRTVQNPTDLQGELRLFSLPFIVRKLEFGTNWIAILNKFANVYRREELSILVRFSLRPKLVYLRAWVCTGANECNCNLSPKLILLIVIFIISVDINKSFRLIIMYVCKCSCKQSWKNTDKQIVRHVTRHACSSTLAPSRLQWSAHSDIGFF